MLTTTARPSQNRLPPLAIAGCAALAALVPLVPLALAVVAGGDASALSLVPVAAIAVLTVAAATDVAENRLPDRLVVLSALPVVLTCCVDPFVSRLDVVPVVLLGALGLAGPILLVHLIAPAEMGFGDVKAAASLGGSLGVVHPVLAVWALCVASATTAGLGVARHRHHVAFGPGLVVGAIAALVIAPFTGCEVVAWR
jgi:leader peptidase (prepilin peptidase)/N-methyltransferase